MGVKFDPILNKLRESDSGGGGGQTAYDAIVAPSGGDYTTLGAAISAASSGWVIFIRPGSYSESAISSSLTNLRIIGAGADSVSITVSGAFAFSGANFTLENVSLNMGANTMTLSANYATLRNNTLNGTATYLSSTTGAQYMDVHDNNFIGTSAGRTIFGGAYARVHDNHFEVVGNTFGAITFSRFRAVFDGNVIHGTSGSGWFVSSSASNAVFTNNHLFGGNTCGGIKLSTESSCTGNMIKQCTIAIQSSDYCTITGNSISNSSASTSIYLQGNGCTVSGNNIVTSSANGQFISVNTTSNNAITGNTIYGATLNGTGIDISTGSRNTVVGNSTYNMTTGINISSASGTNNVLVANINNSATTAISDSGTGTVNANNTT